MQPKYSSLFYEDEITIQINIPAKINSALERYLKRTKIKSKEDFMMVKLIEALLPENPQLLNELKKYLK